MFITRHFGKLHRSHGSQESKKRENFPRVNSVAYHHRQDRPTKKRSHFQQVDLDLNEIADIGAPPSLSVPGWIDYQEWLRRYGARKRKIAKALAIGETTHDVARQFGVSDGRISQMRREFMLDWNKFQGEEN